MALSTLAQQNQASDKDADNNSATALARKVSFLSRPESYKPTADNVVALETGPKPQTDKDFDICLFAYQSQLTPFLLIPYHSLSVTRWLLHLNGSFARTAAVPKLPLRQFKFPRPATRAAAIHT
jgi:hypothetical protein